MNAWPRVRLGDVAEIERDIVAPEAIKSGETYVGLENIVSGGEFTNVGSVKSGELKSAKFAFTPSHILYGKLRPYLAKIALPGFAGICSTDILPVRPGNRLDRQFAAYFLRQPEMVELANSRSSGVNLPRLSPNDLADFEVPLPPLVEQRRIAAILDQADALRAKRRAALAQLDDMAQAIFVEMFGDPAANPHRWPQQTLGQLAIKFSDGPFGSNLKSSHYVDEGVRVVRLQNIGVGEFVDNDRAYISEAHFRSLQKHECRPGDLLIGTLGDPNLRACIQPAWLDVALNKADCVQMRVRPECADREYVRALLNHPSTESLAQDRIVGQTRLRISMGRLRELAVPVPPLALQRRFGERMACLAATKADALKAQQELDTLFAALQHRAFRGEL